MLRLSARLRTYGQGCTNRRVVEEAHHHRDQRDEQHRRERDAEEEEKLSSISLVSSAHHKRDRCLCRPAEAAQGDAAVTSAVAH